MHESGTTKNTPYPYRTEIIELHPGAAVRAGVQPGCHATSESGFHWRLRAEPFYVGQHQRQRFGLTPDGGLSIVLTGGINGSGLAGMTDFVTTATGHWPGPVSFLLLLAGRAPFDFAGYLLGAAFTQLADTDGQSGTGMFSVNSGQMFGFRVGTQDNTGEPGVLTISDFSAPSGTAGAAVPEPATGPLVLTMLGAAIAVHRRIYRSRMRPA